MDQPLFMTVQNAAKALDVSTHTIRRWCDAGLLRAVKIGGRRLVEVASFPKTEFVQQHDCEPALSGNSP